MNTQYQMVMIFNSMRNWIDEDMWNTFLRELENLLDTKLVKLDSRDPVRRKADTNRSEGAYIIDFKQDDSLHSMLFGHFKLPKTYISIESQPFFSPEKYIPNSLGLSIHLPLSQDLNKDFLLINRIFELGNTFLEPFYSYCDVGDVVAYGHTINSPPRLDIQLSGMYYLTHFGKAYTSFFANKLRQITAPACVYSSASGFTLKLANAPDDVSLEQRQEIIKILGKKAFGTPIHMADKQKILKKSDQNVGEYVLSYDTILSYENIVPIDVINANIARAHDYCEGLEQQTLSVPLGKYRQFKEKNKKMPQKVVKEMGTILADSGDPCTVLLAQSNLQLYAQSMSVDADALEYIFSEIPPYMNFDAWDCAGTFLSREFKPMKWSKCKAWEYKDKEANVQFYIILHKEDDTTSNVYISSIDEALIAHIGTVIDKTLDV